MERLLNEKRILYLLLLVLFCTNLFEHIYVANILRLNKIKLDNLQEITRKLQETSVSQEEMIRTLLEISKTPIISPLSSSEEQFVKISTEGAFYSYLPYLLVAAFIIGAIVCIYLGTAPAPNGGVSSTGAGQTPILDKGKDGLIDVMASAGNSSSRLSESTSVLQTENFNSTSNAILHDPSVVSCGVQVEGDMVTCIDGGPTTVLDTLTCTTKIANSNIAVISDRVNSLERSSSNPLMGESSQLEMADVNFLNPMDNLRSLLTESCKTLNLDLKDFKLVDYDNSTATFFNKSTSDTIFIQHKFMSNLLSGDSASAVTPYVLPPLGPILDRGPDFLKGTPSEEAQFALIKASGDAEAMFNFLSSL